MIRHGIALGALTAALAAAGVVAAQQPEPTPATPAPEVAAPTLPAAPIPYNQLRRPPAQAVEQEAEPEEEEEERTEPLRRPRAGAAILQALDKVTAETMRFEARIGQPVRYKGLIFTVRACETAAPDELAPATAAYVIVDSQPLTRTGQRRPARQVYRGWMFANSPSLNPLEHPVYDAWLIACKTTGPSPENR